MTFKKKPLAPVPTGYQIFLILILSLPVSQSHYLSVSVTLTFFLKLISVSKDNQHHRTQWAYTSSVTQILCFSVSVFLTCNFHGFYLSAFFSVHICVFLPLLLFTLYHGPNFSLLFISVSFLLLPSPVYPSRCRCPFISVSLFPSLYLFLFYLAFLSVSPEEFRFLRDYVITYILLGRKVHHP